MEDTMTKYEEGGAYDVLRAKLRNMGAGETLTVSGHVVARNVYCARMNCTRRAKGATCAHRERVSTWTLDGVSKYTAGDVANAILESQVSRTEHIEKGISSPLPPRTQTEREAYVAERAKAAALTAKESAKRTIVSRNAAEVSR
jgi:hypothetical protein